MLDSGVELFIELGPKTVLSGIVKKIVRSHGSAACIQADTPEGLEKVAAAVRS